MILASTNIKYMRIFAVVPRGGASNGNWVVGERNFHRLLLAICSDTLVFRQYMQDIGLHYSPSTAFQFSVVPVGAKNFFLGGELLRLLCIS